METALKSCSSQPDKENFPSCMVASAKSSVLPFNFHVDVFKDRNSPFRGCGVDLRMSTILQQGRKKKTAPGSLGAHVSRIVSHSESMCVRQGNADGSTRLTQLSPRPMPLNWLARQTRTGRYQRTHDRANR